MSGLGGLAVNAGNMVAKTVVGRTNRYDMSCSSLPNLLVKTSFIVIYNFFWLAGVAGMC